MHEYVSGNVSEVKGETLFLSGEGSINRQQKSG